MKLLVFLAATTACLLCTTSTADSRLRRPPPVGSWQAGERWCRAQALGGLFRLPGEEAAVKIRLGARVAAASSGLQRGRCYWAAPESAAAMEELRWMAEGDSSGGSSCLCVRGGAASGGGIPRLRLVDCRRRLPFLCRREPQEEPLEHRDRMPPPPPTTPRPSSAQRHLPPSVEFVPDETSDDPDSMVDEPVDHAKFPLSGMLPAHGLPPLMQPTSATPTGTDEFASPTAVGNSSATTASAAVINSSATRGGGQLGLLSESERSEFVTLVVLYSVVGVVCCVLLVLCVVRCCRGRCGRARIRYVKQVDADDIPRFMPSSWA